MKIVNLLSLVGVTLFISGCQLTHPGSASLAFVEINNAPVERVQKAIVQVFTAEGYTVALHGKNFIIFTREGNMNDRLQYARYEERLTMRVEVTLCSYGENGFLVKADAFAVRGDSDRSSIKLLKIARRPYMQLLDRVKEKAEEAQ